MRSKRRTGSNRQGLSRNERRSKREETKKLKAEWLSMAEGSKNVKWMKRKGTRGKGSRDEEEEGPITGKMNGELKTSGLKAS